MLQFTRAWIMHMLRGWPATPEHLRAERLKICQGCEHFRDGKCGKCGCKIRTAAQWLDKLSWADQRCPLGKWGPVQLPRAPWKRRI